MKTPARRRLPAASATALAGLTLVLFTGSVAFAVPLTPHRVPFPCGQTRTGSTRGSHSPSIRAIDWNRSGDEGDTVVASASGTVTTAEPTGSRGYGHHVVIDHGNGESSVYGHLDAVNVVLGQYVDRGRARRHGRQHRELPRRAPALRGAPGTSPSSPRPSGGVPYFYGSITSFNCVDVPIAGDFTGDAISEVAVYRRGKKSAFVVNDPAGARVLAFGNATDEPVVGDWDGDGAINVGIFRAKKGKFRLQTPTGIVKVRYGAASDRVVAGDWDGNGTDDVGVFRASQGTFYQRMADGSSATVLLGDVDDLPVSGDWDGNGVTDLGVYDRATATFTLRLVDASGRADRTPRARRARRPARCGRLGRRRDHRRGRLDAVHGHLHAGKGIVLRAERVARGVRLPLRRHDDRVRAAPRLTAVRQASRDPRGAASRPSGWSARTCACHRRGGRRRPPCPAGRPAS
ncbi:M23 family metallopeptidase [Nocardioides sp. B-3]|uniref:M23 family metallopeptidase n=1 Tax=Nocardioides sp. B-3 TaxID=2895565 RepID=UPI00300DDFBB